MYVYTHHTQINKDNPLKVPNMHIHQENANSIQFEYTSPRTATHEKTDSKCWLVCGKKGRHDSILVGCKLGQPLWKSVWRFLRHLKPKSPDDSAVPLLSILPNSQFTTEIHALYSCYCCVFHNSKGKEPALMAINR